MSKTRERLANEGMIKALVRRAVSAIEGDNYFEASVILFQTVEGLLRLAIGFFGEGHGISRTNLQKCAATETSFWRLVLHFDMILPDNGLGERLHALNARRNRIMHRVFYDFESMEGLEEELKAFCREAMELNLAVQKILGMT